MVKQGGKRVGYNEAKPLTPEGVEAIKVLRSTVPSVKLFVRACEYKLARTPGDAKVKSILEEPAQSVHPNMKKQRYLSVRKAYTSVPGCCASTLPSEMHS